MPAGSRVLLSTTHNDDRETLSGYIRERYFRAYGARVDHILPTLLGIETPDGALLGAIGTREGRLSEPLYLEAYLDRPAEVALSARLGVRVPRSCIAEVGNLAGGHAGAGTYLVTALAAYLDAIHCTWALFTATTAIRNGFAHLGAGLLDIAAADGTRLGNAALSAWGTYYETAPRVVAAFLPEVLEAVRSRPSLARRVVPLCADARIAGAGRPALEVAS
jgi:hypothetical protein